MIPGQRQALILCNGEPPSRLLARRLSARADLVVAADGGANVARRYGIIPDVIIGDLDSISRRTRQFFTTPGKTGILLNRPGRKPVRVIRNGRQDNTDLEKALDHLKTENITLVSIAGATGRRMDFTLGNLSVIWKYVAGMRMRIVGDEWYAIPVRTSETVRARPGTTVSLIPFGPCSGITLRGLVFPLKDASMGVGEIGVSNVVSTSPFTVSVRKGKILVFVLAPHDYTVAR